MNNDLGSKIKEIQELISLLNKARDDYYNNSESEMTDYEYDCIYDALNKLEKETGIIYSNSPTQTVGFEVKSRLEKVTHNHLMLSLDKTKSVNDLINFIGTHPCLLMCKMDGLTVSLRYVDGKLVSAETRGNGNVGELITHNARAFSNIPLTIDYKDELIVDGEAIITYDTFEKINNKLPENERYKNPRNLVSGSVRQLDSRIAAQRNIKFIAWKCVKGFEKSNSFLSKLNSLFLNGFDIVPNLIIGPFTTYTKLQSEIDILKKIASLKKYPIDGLVLSYDDVEYGNSLGMTGHHVRSQYAFKFYDEEEVTTLKNIEWSIGKTGQITPVAIFEPVEIDGTTVERASLHNVSIFESLQLGIGDEISIYKANQIIPQVKENLTKTNTCHIPEKCPICGDNVEVIKDNESKVLVCSNPDCRGKLLGKLCHAVSRDALNIDGLSEATIDKFIKLGWLTNVKSLYHLNQYSERMKTFSGFGNKSVDKLMNQIEKSRHTTFDRLLYSLSIPLVGKTASKAICKYCTNNKQNISQADFFSYELDHKHKNAFTNISGIGNEIGKSLYDYWINHKNDFFNLLEELVLTDESTGSTENKTLDGKIFVITGNVNHFSNREELKAKIESCGGKVSGSISSKTSYLINNDVTSGSSKNKKAKELNIPIISEEDFLKMI